MTRPFIQRIKTGKFWVSLLLTIMVIYLLILNIGCWYLRKNQESLKAILRTQITKATKGEVSIGLIEGSAWKSFPYIRIGIQDFSLKDTVYHKNLLHIGDIHIGINPWNLFFRKIDISSLSISDGVFNLFTDVKGYSNNYLLNFKNDETPDVKKQKRFSLEIFGKNIYVKNFLIRLDEKNKNKRFGVLVNEIKTSIKKRQDQLDISLDQDVQIEGLGFKLSNGSFLKNMPMRTDWRNMKFDIKTKVLSFDKSPVYFRDTLYNIGGSFCFSSDSATSHMHLDVSADYTSFHHASTILSENIQRTVGKFGWTGPINVKATLDGSLQQSTPTIKVKAVAKNNTLILPDSTAVIDRCSFTGYYCNQEIRPNRLPDDTNSVIRLDGFIGNVNGASLEGRRIYVKDLIHPVISLHLFSKADLADLDKSLDFQTIQFDGGKAVLALNYDGPAASSIHAIENMAGSLIVVDARGRYIPKNFPFHDCNGKITFGNHHLNLEKLRFYINNDYFLINLRGIRKGTDTSLLGVPQVDCDVTASQLNLDNFISIFQTPDDSVQVNRNTSLKTSISKEALPIDDLLKKGELQLHLKAESILFKKFKGHNLQTDMSFKFNHWSIDTLKLSHAGGTLSLNSKMTQYAKYNDVSFQVRMRNIDIQKTFYAFENFGIDAISYQNLQGKLDIDGRFETKIDENGNIIHQTTNGDLHFDLRNGRLLNFLPIRKIQNYAFKKRNLNDISFAPIQSSFQLQNGIIYLHPLRIRSSVIDLIAEGIYSPYGDTDMELQIPFSSLKSTFVADTSANDALNTKAFGAALHLNVVGSTNNDAKLKVNLLSGLKGNQRPIDFLAKFNSLKQKRKM